MSLRILPARTIATRKWCTLPTDDKSNDLASGLGGRDTVSTFGWKPVKVKKESSSKPVKPTDRFNWEGIMGECDGGSMKKKSAKIKTKVGVGRVRIQSVAKELRKQYEPMFKRLAGQIAAPHHERRR